MPNTSLNAVHIYELNVVWIVVFVLPYHFHYGHYGIQKTTRLMRAERMDHKERKRCKISSDHGRSAYLRHPMTRLPQISIETYEKRSLIKMIIFQTIEILNKIVKR